ncbi:hypothetical protein [Aureivirga sp. CE67]|uniref:hypothetical protein n=1 Tax=Aureivirga sp. CE67 TaxID=1788983 RepID=UPI0018C9B3F2|nr:hypothetical protein [Aureivirga sp. CE67]
MNLLVYKNNISRGKVLCGKEFYLSRYLDLKIQKFNYLYNKNIGFYGEETIEGEELKKAIDILTDELLDLIENYHQDADPNGFGRSAWKVKILGRNLILNHFACKMDQIIYSLNKLLEFLKSTEKGNGRVEIYGLGDIDVFDCHIICEIKNILETDHICYFENLKKLTKYIFDDGNVIGREPNILRNRIEKLENKGYLKVNENSIEVTVKGEIVEKYE